ncbi:MAG: FadR/GntR family transcriptional regulator [Microbacterium gubbeenense]|uniref:FadR/GntR family transcriptional regulator n=1 Tax=Microbacterium gubbeenense TaxID=159896 RepID=UPI003F9ADF5F
MTASRGEQLSGILADRIIGGDISPGERLASEAKLVAEFGASRSVVREALQRLHTRGLIRTRTGSGSYALVPPATASGEDWLTATDESERAELIAFRVAIESESAALAARVRTERDLDAIDGALAALGSAALPVETVDADFAFHRAVAAASGNRYLAAALERIGARAIILPAARISDSDRDPADSAAVVSEHAAVAHAIRSSDPLAAAAAMRAHLTASAARRSA